MQVGTATFVHPKTMNLMVGELEAYCRRKGISALRTLIGSLDDSPATPFGALP